MSQPFFSILILFWQSEQYLQRCLQSLKVQTFQDFEVILLDNGSSQPPDPEVLASIEDVPVKLLRSETNWASPAETTSPQGRLWGSTS